MFSLSRADIEIKLALISGASTVVKNVWGITTTTKRNVQSSEMAHAPQTDGTNYIEGRNVGLVPLERFDLLHIYLIPVDWSVVLSPMNVRICRKCTRSKSISMAEILDHCLCFFAFFAFFSSHFPSLRVFSWKSCLFARPYRSCHIDEVLFLKLNIGLSGIFRGSLEHVIEGYCELILGDCDFITSLFDHTGLKEMGIWNIRVPLPGLHFDLVLLSVDFEGDGHFCLSSDGIYPDSLV